MPWVSQGLGPKARPRGTLAYLGQSLGKSLMASVAKNLAFTSHGPANVSRCCCQISRLSGLEGSRRRPYLVVAAG